MARLATQVMLGKKLQELGLVNMKIPHYGVKEAVFPFNMFPEVDPLLGPEMRSTGEVLGMADSFGLAFYKAQEATQQPLPLEGTVLITLNDRDKPASIEPARLFREMGFRITATEGTHRYLSGNGIECDSVHKLGHGRPDIIDEIKNGAVQLVINTPGGQSAKEDDSYIRKAAINYKIPYITTTAAALSAARGIAARRNGRYEVKSLQSYHEDINCRADFNEE